jgi:hypothetical protein
VIGGKSESGILLDKSVTCAHKTCCGRGFFFSGTLNKFDSDNNLVRNFFFSLSFRLQSRGLPWLRCGDGKTVILFVCIGSETAESILGIM